MCLCSGDGTPLEVVPPVLGGECWFGVLENTEDAVGCHAVTLPWVVPNLAPHFSAAFGVVLVQNVWVWRLVAVLALWHLMTVAGAVLYRTLRAWGLTQPLLAFFSRVW